MGKLYLFLFLFFSIIFIQVQAQKLGEYKATVEVIEVCGYGTPEGDFNDYRWRFVGKLEGETVGSWDGTVGIDNVPGGTCLGIEDNQAAGRVGSDLPLVLFSDTYTYTEDKVLEIEIEAEGYEKNCFPGTDNGDYLAYKEDCWCKGTFFTFPCDFAFQDKDFRRFETSIPLNIPQDIGTDTWEFPVTNMDGKYSFVLRYTVTPPVMEAPHFFYPEDFILNASIPSPIQTTCAGEEYYIVWDGKDYPKDKIEKVNWYENVVTSGKAIWELIGTTDSQSDLGRFAIKIPASDFSGEKTYAVKAIAADGITTNIDYSLPSLPITIYPRPPEIKELPTNVTDTILHPNESNFITNDYIEIQHVECTGDATGSFSIKKIDDSRNFYYTLDPLGTQTTGGNIGERAPPSASNPVVFSGLQSGRYQLRVEIRSPEGKDFCYSDDIIVIKQPAALPSATATASEYEGGANVSCHDAEDGEITISATGGTPPYSYSLHGSDGDTIKQAEDSVFRNLNALDNEGKPVIYTFSLTDKYGCFYEDMKPIQLTVPDTLKFVDVDPVHAYKNPNDEDESYDVMCYGYTDALEFTLSGGALPYRLYIGDELKATTQGESHQAIINGLKADTVYQVKVVDANGCDTLTAVSLTQPEQIVLESHQVIPAACFGSASASLGLKAAKGLPFPGQAYLYSIRHLAVPDDIDFPFETEQSITSPVDSAVFINLIAGSYAVTIEDAFGCIGVDTVTVSQPERLNVAVTSSFIQCVGNTNGNATASISGGTAPFKVTWTDEFKKPVKVVSIAAGESPSIEGLSGGLYYVFVEDANGCQYPRSGTPFTIQEPAMALDLFYAQLEHASCFGQADGSVTLQASGGWRNVPYKFGLDKTKLAYNENVYSQLQPGDYTFYVEDGRGCMDSVALTIEEPAVLQVKTTSQTPVSCYGGANGSVKLEASGGVPPYKYSIDNGATWSEDGYFDGLKMDDYQVLIVDANGNCPLMKTIHIQQPLPLAITIVGSEGTGCGLTKGSARVNVSGGIFPYTYRWTDNAGVEIGNSLSKEELASGRYWFSVTDASDCELSKVVTISNPEGPQAEIASIKAVSCSGGNDGSASLRIISSNSMATILWPDGQRGELATGLQAGEHIVEIIDEASCITFLPVYIPEPAPLSLTFESTEPSCSGNCDATVTLAATGGNGNYIYTWADGYQGAFRDGLCAGAYTVEVSDHLGCETSLQIYLDDPEPVEPDLGGSVTICEGQEYILDAGYPGASYSWTSTGGFSANTRKISVSEAGTYTVEVTDVNGCKGTSSFDLHISNDILEADFLVLTEAVVGDTVVLVNISYPEPVSSEWVYPEEVKALDAYGYHQQLVFPQEGSYLVTLYTELANCEAEMTKQIIVTATNGATSEDVFGYQGEVVEEFKLYPNPNSGKFTVSVILSEAKDIRLKLIDIQGQADLGDYQGLGKDSYEVSYNFNALQSGVYFLLLEVDGNSQTLKVIIN